MKIITNSLSLFFVISFVFFGCSKQSDNISSEIIFREEGYESKYTYQIYNKSYEYSDKKIFGFNLATSTGAYAFKFSNGNIENLGEYTLYEEEQNKFDDFFDQLADEEKGIYSHQSLYSILDLEDARYVLMYEYGGDNICRLFKQDNNSQITYVDISMDASVSPKLATYDNLIRIKSINENFWFDKNLNRCEAPEFNESDYELTKSQLIKYLSQSFPNEFKDLWKEVNTEYGLQLNIILCERVDDIYHIIFQKPGTTPYIAEIDNQGNVKALYHLINTGVLESKLKYEVDGNYFDVMH